MPTNPFSTVFNELTSDAKASLLGLLTVAHANIKANPTPQTVTAQYALALLTAPTLLPVLEADTITKLNDALLEAATSVLGEAPTPTPAAA